MVENEFHPGDIVRVKVGKNLVEAEVVGLMPNGLFNVKSLNTQKEFGVKHIHELVFAAKDYEQEEKPEPEPVTEPVTEPEEAELASDGEDEEAGINPVHESDRPKKRMSLMNAAVQLLRESPVPMNTREIVAAAIEAGLWEPTGSKTPEQSLYGSIFREIAAKDHPRIVRAEQKGKFRIAE
jgi:hypothetical protein